MRVDEVGAGARAAESLLAIRIGALDKGYRSPITLRRKPVLRGLDLEVRTGEVFGFLGLNGAGKTTTIRCLVGLIRPDQGELEVLGGSPASREVRRRLGYLPENPALPDYLTPIEVLELMGRLTGLERPRRRERIAELVSMLRLERAARTPLRKLSKGTVQRVGIAQAVLHEPELLILDEPMSGLDPLGRGDVRALIDRERLAGRTVFFSSHIVPDVEAICDRVGILADGRLIKTGRIDELTTVRLQAVEIELKNVRPGDIRDLLDPEDEIEERGTVIRVLVHDPARVDQVVARALASGGRVGSLERRRERLEDYFVRTAEERAA
jgi:ABC-2 type transport system ATP-binding protein